MNSRRSVLLIAAVVAIVFAPLLVPGRVLFTPDELLSDLGHLYIPLRLELVHALNDGRLPVWSRDLGTGVPILAEGQISVFYPPVLLAHMLLPWPLAINLLALLNLVIVGAGTYRWSRLLGLTPAAATYAGLIAALCGWSITHLKYLCLLAVASWTPWLLSGVELALSGRGSPTMRIGLAVGMMALAGNPTALYFSLVVAATHALVGAALTRRPRALFPIVAGVLLGVCLGAVQLLPTADYVSQSTRGGGLTWDQINVLSYHPQHLKMFVFPFLFGDPSKGTWPLTEAAMHQLWPGTRAYFWEVCGYVGWLPLCLATMALVLAWTSRGSDSIPEPPTPPCQIRYPTDQRPGRDDILRLGFLGLFCLMLILGEHTPLGPFLFHTLPGFNHFRFHSRFLFHLDLVLAVLAGYAAQKLTERLPPRHARLVWIVFGAITVGDLHTFGRGQNLTVAADRWVRPSVLAETLSRDVPGVRGPYRVHGLFPSTPWSEAQQGRPWVESLEDCIAARAMPAPNTGLFDGLTTLDVYAPLAPVRLDLIREIEADLLRTATIAARGGSRGLRRLDLTPAVRPLNVLGLWNVAYLISPVALSGPLLEPVAKLVGELFVYRLNTVRPRTMVFYGATFVRDEQGALAFFRSTTFDPNVLPLEAPDPISAQSPAESRLCPRPTEAVIVHSAPDGLTADVNAERPGWFYVSELYDPGWQAWLDGEPVAMAPAAGLGMAAPITAGPHRLTLRYRCRTLRLGLLFTTLGLCIGLALQRRARAVRAVGSNH